MRLLVGLALALASAGASAGCSGAGATGPEPIGVGLIMSFSGDRAAYSANSERALIMAVDAANGSGGVGGRPLRLMARDSRSDPGKIIEPARALRDAGVAVLIGPDTRELAVELRAVWEGRTVILPSFATSDPTHYKPASWFSMGASPLRVACELMSQVRSDQRRNAVVIADPNGFNYVAWDIARIYSLPALLLPSNPSSNEAAVQAIAAASADGYVLAALPPSASSLFYALAAMGRLGDPRRWYLAPTLHTPALLETVPVSMLLGARGVSTGTGLGGHEFRERFVARWQDQPLDDAYPFYDAGAITALALQRAITHEGAVPDGTGLSPHVVAVTQGTGTTVLWNELGRGLELLRQGGEVSYVGVTGVLNFDATGHTQTASTKWWTVEEAGFVDVASTSECR